MKEYKNIKIVRFVPGAQVDCELTRPIPCTNEYFVHAFWMPIKHQIGEKVVFSLQTDYIRFSLIYNQAAVGIDNDDDPVDSRFVKEDSEKIFEVAMNHIDDIMEHFYCKERTGNIIPFIDELCPIASTDGSVITLNGCLPMKKAYFIKKYWNKIKKKHHKENEGVRFHFHLPDEFGTKISISAELCRYNAVRDEKGLQERDAAEVENHQVQLVLCDVADAVVDAAYEYAQACRKNSYIHI